jgi:hypothetical protein
MNIRQIVHCLASIDADTRQDEGHLVRITLKSGKEILGEVYVPDDHESGLVAVEPFLTPLEGDTYADELHTPTWVEAGEIAVLSIYRLRRRIVRS